MRRGLGVAVTTLLVLGVASAAFYGPIRSTITRWQGSPTHTVPYEPPADHPRLVRIAVAGDVGIPGARLERTAATMKEIAGRRGFDVLLLLGDNVYPDGDPARLRSTVFRPFAPLLDRGTRLLAILGNHDVKNGNGPRQVRALDMDGRWWATTVGDVQLVGLDSNDIASERQRRWAAATLCSTEAPWSVVAVHHPPYSAGYQGSSRETRRFLDALLPGRGVALVLSGHDHDYQRSKVIEGVTYVVSGAAAEARRTSHRDYTAVSWSWHHFVELDVYPDRLVGRAINQDGRVADSWTIRARPDRDACPPEDVTSDPAAEAAGRRTVGP